MFGFNKKSEMPDPQNALPGRSDPVDVPPAHAILGNPMQGPFPDHLETAIFGMGCFWGIERLFWQQPGVYTTAVGYLGGTTKNPLYEEVCSGQTGHNEVVKVVFDPAQMSYQQLLTLFWESHDPTQGMRQGNDTGTQYRSGVYTMSDQQQAEAIASRDEYQRALAEKAMGAITTEIIPADTFYFAEGYHQQYLAKNPNGYCNMRGTGVSCPIASTNV